MINLSTIMKQVQEWLEDDEGLDDVVVERSEFVNEDAGAAVNGWIGVYRRSIDYDPRTLGVSPNNYEGDVEFMVIVQRSALSSGADCEDALEETVKQVLDRVVQIPKLYIDHFSNIQIDYTYLEEERTTMYFQGALITFTAEVSFEVE